MIEKISSRDQKESLDIEPWKEGDEFFFDLSPEDSGNQQVVSLEKERREKREKDQAKIAHLRKELGGKESIEELRPFDLKFYVTDHSPDSDETGTPQKLKSLYEDVRRDGVTSMRYDFRWNKIEPNQGGVDLPSLERYGSAIPIMNDAGLEAPTIVLSSIPQWAMELYKTDKAAFFTEYQKYIEGVKNQLLARGQQQEKDLGEGKVPKVERFQVLNELNNPIYTKISPEDIPRLCAITREVMKEYNPDLKLLGTLFAGNLLGIPKVAKKFGQNLGDDVLEYLDSQKDMLSNFDVLAVDYYPGMYHVPIPEYMSNGKEIFKQLGLLEQVMEKIAKTGVEYELGEVGIQTNIPLFGEKGNEERQRYFYDVFFREFKHMMLDFKEKGIPLPSRVGLYEAQDEAPKGFINKILSKIAHPEFALGMRQSRGQGAWQRKEILKGNRHRSEEERTKKPSQLRKIISYMNAPMKRT